MKSNDIARSGSGPVRPDPPQVVKAQQVTPVAPPQESVFKKEVLPRLGIVAFLGGISVMSAMNNILKRS